MNDSFLLNNEIAQELYQAMVELPIIDFHNHLSVADLSTNRKYDNITQLWLEADPYKHRAMRILGVDEELITGKNSSSIDKFKIWATVLPQLVGNPLFHWSILELKSLFNITQPLNEISAIYIYDQINEQLKEDKFKAQNILNYFNVEYAAPCVSIVENVACFKDMPNIVPSLRGDDFTLPVLDFLNNYPHIQTLDDYKEFLIKHINILHQSGCRVADHALDDGFIYQESENKTDELFLKILNNKQLSTLEVCSFSSEILRFVGKEYAKRDWTMQLHIGALRYTSSRLRQRCGGAGGYAGISGKCDISGIVRFLDTLEIENALPQVILYSLNPTHSVPLAILSGSFPRVQLGPAWWYCDHIYGIQEVMDIVANYGVLSTFVGMTTDSRSLASFVRHDYFRRTLATWLSKKVKNQQMPNDMKLLKNLINNIAYINPKKLERI